MGVSALSAMIGLAFVASGVIRLVSKRQTKTAVAFLFIGGLLIIVPVSVIYWLGG